MKSLCSKCHRPVVVLDQPNDSSARPLLCLLCRKKNKLSGHAQPKGPQRPAPSYSIPPLETKEQIDSWIAERKQQYKSRILAPKAELERGLSEELEEGEAAEEPGRKSRRTCQYYQRGHCRRGVKCSFLHQVCQPAQKRHKVSLYDLDEDEDQLTAQDHHRTRECQAWMDDPSVLNSLLMMIQYILSRTE